MMEKHKTVLHAKNVRKSFGTRGNVQEVLKGIELRVAEGEFVGIMGPSGAGKRHYSMSWQRLTVQRMVQF